MLPLFSREEPVKKEYDGKATGYDDDKTTLYLIAAAAVGVALFAVMR